jgi:large subunit ribosomal protein L19e
MDLLPKKKLAARLLGVGESRVKIDPQSQETVADAITRESIRGLISAGLIWSVPARGVSRGRVRRRRHQRQLRGVGPGSKKGVARARAKGNLWSDRVRVLRKKLRMHKDRGDITHATYWSVYRQVKGGQIRTLKRLEEVIQEAGSR